MTLPRSARALAALLLAGCATTEPPPAPPAEPTRAERDAPPAAVATLEPATGAPRAAPPAPEAASAPPQASALTEAQVAKTFAHHQRHFASLYGARLQARPDLSGQVLVDFTVSPDGTPQDVRLVESSLGDPEFEQAVLKKVGEMTFPPATTATPVRRYPIAFNKTGPKKP